MSSTLTDTRALLRLFRQSGYNDLHLKLDGYELFVARAEGRTNPLHARSRSDAREGQALSVLTPQDAASAGTPAPAGAEQVVVAPHLASFVSALPVGSTVAAGEAVVRLELLGEPIDVAAQQAGIVADVLAQPGALVEYAAPLMKLAAA